MRDGFWADDFAIGATLRTNVQGGIALLILDKYNCCPLAPFAGQVLLWRADEWLERGSALQMLAQCEEFLRRQT